MSPTVAASVHVQSRRLAKSMELMLCTLGEPHPGQPQTVEHWWHAQQIDARVGRVEVGHSACASCTFFGKFLSSLLFRDHSNSMLVQFWPAKCADSTYLVILMLDCVGTVSFVQCFCARGWQASPKASIAFQNNFKACRLSHSWGNSSPTPAAAPAVPSANQHMRLHPAGASALWTPSHPQQLLQAPSAYVFPRSETARTWGDVQRPKSSCSRVSCGNGSGYSHSICQQMACLRSQHGHTATRTVQSTLAYAALICG
jgi:hypothetical protein